MSQPSNASQSSARQPQNVTLKDLPAILAGFADETTPSSRALATVQLSQLAVQEPSQLPGSLQKLLLQRIKEDESYISAALRLLSTLYAIAPSEAHTILFDSPGSLASQLYPKIGSSTPAQDLLKTELITSAAGYTDSRTVLKSRDDISSWLRSATLDEASSDLQRLALLAALSQYKIEQGPANDNGLGMGDLSINESAEDRQKRKSQLETSLLRLARTQVLAAGSVRLEDEEERIGLMSALEALSYISTDLNIKGQIASDRPLLQALFSLPQTVRKAVFPSRDDKLETTSSYQLDSVLSATVDSLSMRLDGSIQYAISTIILNLVIYPPMLSNEQKQMQKLRAMANAQKQSKEGQQPKATTEQTASIDQRVRTVVDAGAAVALTALAMPGSAGEASKGDTGSSGLGVNSSSAIRKTVGEAFLHLTTRQDKAQRGKIAQAGGAKALLALSHAVLLSEGSEFSKPNPLSQASGASADLDFAPLQALARLSITTSPAILFGSPSAALSSISPLVVLYLHPGSAPLQKFEALLALTNVASISPTAAAKVAEAKLKPEMPGVDKDCSVLTISEGLETTILLEDDRMLKRAAVELLCNLAQTEGIFKRWSGEEQETKSQGGLDVKADRARTRLHLLVALCSPGATQSSSPRSETTLATRLAASGALAMLCSSPVACRITLSLEAKTLSILARLAAPGTALTHSEVASATIREIQDDEEDEEAASTNADEAQLEELDASSSPSGPAHARASLALRGVTILHSLVQYVDWARSSSGQEISSHLSVLKESGIVQALSKLALQGVQELRQPSPPASGGTMGDQEARAMRGEVTQMAFESLKTLKSLGVNPQA